MIDFIKMVYVLDDIKEFILKHNNEMTGIGSLSTGELEFPYKFKYRLYDVTIRQRSDGLLYYIEIAGSLHKNYYNGMNYMPFSFKELEDEIYEVCEHFLFVPDKLKIQNLEIGINVKTSFSPYEYLTNNLLLYKTKPFKAYKKGENGKELGYYCEGLPQVKIYDKGKQYDLPYNLLRFEIRYKKSFPLNKLGVITLGDLLKIQNLKKLSEKVCEAWGDVLLYEEDLDLKSMNATKREIMFYNYCEYTKNWMKWFRNFSRGYFYNKKKEYKILINKYGKNEHSELGTSIKSKLEECTKMPVDYKTKMHKFTDTLKG